MIVAPKTLLHADHFGTLHYVGESKETLSLQNYSLNVRLNNERQIHES